MAICGTRFRLFPQASFAAAEVAPETVQIATPARQVGPGPADHRAYTVYPIGKRQPYGISMDLKDNTLSLPPWHGPIYLPALPDAEGHFDYLPPGTKQFEMAHLFGTVRFVIDVWESYFRRPIRWQFGRDFPRLELSILPSLQNAYAGYGFIEVGGHGEGESFVPYSLNFDVIAHEVGHAIIYSELGVPDPEAATGEYFGFHESAADLVSLISSLHFNSVVDDLLLTTRGNLYTLNQVSRMAELSPDEQIRLSSNDRRLSEFSRGWKKEHDLSQPLTGAFFDILVDIFHEELLARELITPSLEEMSDKLLATPHYTSFMQRLFDDAFARDPDGFKMALLRARDILGTYLATTWDLIEKDDLNYVDVAEVFLEVDRQLNGGRFLRLIRGNFDLRDIGWVEVGPQLQPFGSDSHAGSVRTLVPRKS
ncbi:hypothetical protein VQ042_22320 [Aurantimonas sp. A2-1-M11]|uniref:hypothetical protein n=1 Tax=Aurantimonas sp. A2-1-M11 TaxID=3113712 RepID=UPI002F95BFDE